MSKVDKGRMRKPALTAERVRDALRYGEWLTPVELRERLDHVCQSFLNKMLREACSKGLLRRQQSDFRTSVYVYQRTDGALARAGSPYPTVLYGPGVPDASAQIAREMTSLWVLNARR